MRASTILAKNTLGTDLICAEVGVKDGENAQTILDLLSVKKLYLIDPYIPYDTSSDEKALKTSLFASSKDEMESYYEQAKNRFSNYNGTVSILRVPSDEASILLKDVRFDFVYIDGNHSSEFVSKDLNNWYPLVKEGGILAGHDSHFNEVIRSVNEFTSSHISEIEFGELLYDWVILKKKLTPVT